MAIDEALGTLVTASPRSLVLAFGPLVLVGGSYWLSQPAVARSVIEPPPAAPAFEAWNWPASASAADLDAECRRAASRLDLLAEGPVRSFVKPPFVLAGDLTTDELSELYRETVAPIVRALFVDYLDRPADSPIVVLMFRDSDRYRALLSSWKPAVRAEYAGLYLRDQRIVLIDAQTGPGTLAHELFHALAHVDAPHLPEWFDEGAASLHEECTFSSDGLHLLGQENWRGALVRQALDQHLLPPLAEFLSQPFAAAQPSLDYAYARYFCLFLQERGLLAPLYRKLSRANHGPFHPLPGSPRGDAQQKHDFSHSSSSVDGAADLAAVALTALAGTSLDDLDQQFRAWLRSSANPPHAASPAELKPQR